ncbi:MAG: DUF72 domain-containing protein [Patescibacteria group bacterium]|nr:DUF72 domain-containing protein [Patescibacteria group bacterium]
MPKGKLFIGTSGWIYSHWEGIFYPEDLPGKDKLKYFSKHFKTAEINYSFYHLPRPSTYQNWYSQTPEDFLFAVKASRFITHIKRLKGVREAWKTFLENALYLKEKLGPILFQFPPSFKAAEENIKRLNQFLILLKTYRGQTSVNLRFACEFRHISWCDKKIYNLLKKYNVAWVIADSPSYPKAEVVTADFVYIRMHGSKVLFSSKYTKEELSPLAQKIKKWLKQNLNVYVYFNNDAMGYAIENAKTLLKLCNKINTF